MVYIVNGGVKMDIKRGQIWVAYCPKPKDQTEDKQTHIHYGIRPVVILGNEKGNNSGLLLIVKGTTRIKNLNQPTRVLVKGFGLMEPTVFMAEQMTSLDDYNLIRYVGELDENTMSAIDKAVEIHTGLFEPFSLKYVIDLIEEINEIDRFFSKYRITEEESIIRVKRMKELENYCGEYGYNYKIFLKKYLEYENTKEVNLCG